MYNKTVVGLGKLSTMLAMCLAAAQPTFADSAVDYRGLDLGAFVGGNIMSGELELGNAVLDDQVPGSGVNFGVRVAARQLLRLPRIGSIELSLSPEVEYRFLASSTDGSMMRKAYFAPQSSFRAHVRADATIKDFTPFVVVGFSIDSVISRSPFIDNETDTSFYWGAGLTYRVSGRFGARIDVRHIVSPGRFSTFSQGFEATIGLSYQLGGDLPSKAPPRLTSEEKRDQECKKGMSSELLPKDGCPDPVVSQKETDEDKDTVMSPLDKCPNEPEDIDGFEDADGCPDPDNDGDKVLDKDDQCPDVAEDRDNFADEDGCPDVDNDVDGMPDENDRCPDAPETINGFQDDDGCPDEMPAELKALNGIAKPLRFRRNATRLSPGARRYLDGVAAVMKKFPRARLVVKSYSDDRGSEKSRKKVTTRRAFSIRTYLVKKGVWRDRITPKGYGSEFPIADNGTSAGRRQNRRIEFEVLFAEPAAKKSAPASKGADEKPAKGADKKSKTDKRGAAPTKGGFADIAKGAATTTKTKTKR